MAETRWGRSRLALYRNLSGGAASGAAQVRPGLPLRRVHRHSTTGEGSARPRRDRCLLRRRRSAHQHREVRRRDQGPGHRRTQEQQRADRDPRRRQRRRHTRPRQRPPRPRRPRRRRTADDRELARTGHTNHRRDPMRRGPGRSGISHDSSSRSDAGPPDRGDNAAPVSSSGCHSQLPG